MISQCVPGPIPLHNDARCDQSAVTVGDLLRVEFIMGVASISFRFTFRFVSQFTSTPKSLTDPHITRVLGTPGPHIPSDMLPPPVPISLGIWGRGSPNWGLSISRGHRNV